MKLAVYELSELEKPFFQQIAKEYDLELCTTEQVLSKNNLSLAAGCKGITILGMSRVDDELLQQIKGMGIEYLTTRTIGYDHIDMDAAKKYKISVKNSTYGPDGVAEFTVMLMLLVLRNYKPAMWRQQVNDYSLNGLLGRELKHMKVGVVGTGRIGAAVAKILKGFGCEILAFDIKENENIRSDVTYVPLNELYNKADIISLHMPLLEETKYMINRDTLLQMKEQVILINTARGELVDTNALIERMEQKKIGGLGLDVLAEEQGVYHYDKKTDILTNREMSYLRQFPNVVMTQHMAFYTESDIRDMVYYGVQGLLDMIQGENRQ